MPVRCEWADSRHQICHFYLDTPWTWAELRVVGDAMFEEIRGLDHPVATIVDVSRVKGVPKGDILSNLQHVDAQMPSNVFASVVVGAPRVIIAFMNVLIRLRPSAKRIALFARTLDEAHLLVQQRLEQMETHNKI